MFMTNTMAHPDEYWQGLEVAYKAVYSDRQDVWLPWEWSDEYRLRNTIYPMYLSIPLRIARYLGLDSNAAVRTIPYLAHLPLVILNDIFFWKFAKRLVSKDNARLGFALFFVNRFQTSYMIRTGTNAVEQFFNCLSFYFYLDQKDKFTAKTAILTALISTSFMIRNTSPVGWIPLLAHKVIFDGSFMPFLKAGIIIALPVIALCVYVDTVMYQSDTWVFTSYNFLEMNILHGLSKYFGEDPWWWYWICILPLDLHIIYPFLPFAIGGHLRT
jgi:hypothetical protein